MATEDIDATRLVMLVGFSTLASTPEEQTKMAARIFDWPEARVAAAFEDAHAKGWIGLPEPEEAKETLEATLEDLVASGDMKIVGHDAEGEPQYALTEQGQARAAGLVKEAGGTGKGSPP